jgi:alpha-tubulin suppressor-like RCC1 family protein
VNLGVNASVRGLFAGYSHTAVILASGELVTWGQNLYGELGLGYSSEYAPSSVPYPDGIVPRPVNRTATSVCFGANHMCVLWDNGAVSCAGSAYGGPTGYGDSTTRSTYQSLASLPYVSLGVNKTASQIACGHEHTVVLYTDRTVRTWGQGSSGQLGTGVRQSVGDAQPVSSSPLVPIPVGMLARQVVAGDYHTCILANVTATGLDYVFCTGAGYALGAALNADTSDALWPLIVPLPQKPITSIAANSDETCVVFRDGTFTCFGATNEYGQQGTGDSIAVGGGMLPETVADLQVRMAATGLS